jgi:hypothetical protein
MTFVRGTWNVHVHVACMGELCIERSLIISSLRICMQLSCCRPDQSTRP